MMNYVRKYGFTLMYIPTKKSVIELGIIETKLLRMRSHCVWDYRRMKMKMKQDELNKILEQHKLWLKTKGKEGEKADLRWTDLRGVDLSGADLTNTIFKENEDERS